MMTPTTMPGRAEFVMLISLVMMLIAFAIDSMLPALPAIGAALGVRDANDRPLVISVFLIGFGIGQLMIGTISDRYGRRAPLLIAVVGFVVANLAAIVATDFTALLIARAVQGVFAAAARVVVTSIVRDRFAGRDMAQVMSLASMLFMAAPILAPAMGQLVLSVAPWPAIFGVLALIGCGVGLWVLLRLPETLVPSARTPIRTDTVIASVRTVLTDRMSLGYSLANAAISSGLFGFLVSVQQIFEITFKSADRLPTGFAIMASGMAVASLLNAAVVRRFGMRRIGHGALFFFTAAAFAHACLAWSGTETLASFIGLQTVMMLGYALIVGNFGAMAMETMGSVAGTASSVQGSLSTLIGSIAGTIIGQSFDGTTLPLYVGFTLSGLAALGIVYVTEGGQFFTARNAPLAGV